MGRSHTSSSTDSLYYPQYQWTSVLRDIFAHLSVLLKLERSILGIIASYAVAIGLFLLCVPIAVQELVSTFSFAMEPRMIFTLTLFVASSLTGVAAFRVLQARAVETLQQRIYTSGAGLHAAPASVARRHLCLAASPSVYGGRPANPRHRRHAGGPL